MNKKINFDQEVVGLGGNVITDHEQKPLALKDLCVTALIGTYDDERPNGKEKNRRGILAKKIHGGGVIEINQNERETIKTLIGKGYAPVVVTAVWDLLDEEEEKPSAPKLVEPPAEAAPPPAAEA